MSHFEKITNRVGHLYLTAEPTAPKQGRIDVPDVQEPVDMPPIDACIIGGFTDIALKVSQKRLKIDPAGLLQHLFLEFDKCLSR